jgi:hypothetical protein
MIGSGTVKKVKRFGTQSISCVVPAVTFYCHALLLSILRMWDLESTLFYSKNRKRISLIKGNNPGPLLDPQLVVPLKGIFHIM